MLHYNQKNNKKAIQKPTDPQIHVRVIYEAESMKTMGKGIEEEGAEQRGV